MPNGVCDVADDFDLWEVDGVDFGGVEVDVDDLDSVRVHEEWRFFDDVVADVDDEVGVFDGAVDEVVCGQCGVADEERVALVDDAFSHLGGDEWDALFVDEFAKLFCGEFAVGSCADD